MNIDEFIKSRERNGYLEEEGFDQLYCRKSKRFLVLLREIPPNRSWYQAFDIAGVEVTHKGQGTFKKLIRRIRRDYPDLAIFVECVQVKRLGEALVRMGFRRHHSDPNSYILRPEDPLNLPES